MKKIGALLYAVLVLNCFACTKDDELVIERKQWLLINKKWQLSGMSINTGGIVVNEYDSLPSYRKDDYFIFRPDSTYEFNDNADTMPGNTSSILDIGTWTFNEKQMELGMHSDQYNSTYNPAKILELTTTNLSLQRTHPGDGSITVTNYIAF